MPNDKTVTTPDAESSLRASDNVRQVQHGNAPSPGESKTTTDIPTRIAQKIAFMVSDAEGKWEDENIIDLRDLLRKFANEIKDKVMYGGF